MNYSSKIDNIDKAIANIERTALRGLKPTDFLASNVLNVGESKAISNSKKRRLF